MSRKAHGRSVLSGLFWSFGERITAQLVTFVITVILARILTPGDYGAVSLILVFITLANVFVTNGFGESLIQKQDANERDFSTIFWCSLVLSLLLYVALFTVAPFIADFYENELLCPMIQVLAIKLPISSFGTIQHAYVSKHMQFKKFFFSTLAGTLISGIVGVTMAYLGFGPWAIVAQYLVNTTIDTIVLFFTVPWRPHFWFDGKSARELMGFGWKMMLSAFINSAYQEIRSLIIGKIYSEEDLAQYKRGNQFPQLIITNINTAVSSVIFPTLAIVNDDIAEVKRLTRKSMIMTSYLIFPMMVILGVVADPLVRLLLTEKWLPCVPFLQLACITYGLQPIQTANCQAIKSIGRSDVYLIMEVVKKSIGIGLLLLVMHRSVMAIALADVVAVGASAIISVLPNRRLINYSIKNQIGDLLPAIIMSALTGICILPIRNTSMSILLILVCQVTAGIVVYCLLSLVTKNEAFVYLKATTESILNRGSNHA